MLGNRPRGKRIQSFHRMRLAVRLPAHLGIPTGVLYLRLYRLFRSIGDGWK